MQNIAPLVVFRDTAVCDGCGIEAELTTDGDCAFGGTSLGCSLTGFSRDGSQITAACDRVSRNVPCHGWFTFDLATEGGWDAVDNIVAESLAFSEQVER